MMQQDIGVQVVKAVSVYTNHIMIFSYWGAIQLIYGREVMICCRDLMGRLSLHELVHITLNNVNIFPQFFDLLCFDS